MRKVIACVLIGVLAMSIGSYAKETYGKPDPPYALSRGFANIMGGWLELPRGIIYENTRIPIIGFVVGPIKGSLLTVWRELAGVVDVVGMGLTRQGLYAPPCIPDFVWDAEWIPSKGEDIVSPGGDMHPPMRPMMQNMQQPQGQCPMMGRCPMMQQKGSCPMTGRCPMMQRMQQQQPNRSERPQVQPQQSPMAGCPMMQRMQQQPNRSERPQVQPQQSPIAGCPMMQRMQQQGKPPVPPQQIEREKKQKEKQEQREEKKEQREKKEQERED